MAIDAQRHTEAQLNARGDGYMPELKTSLKLKRHAASVYIISMLKDVQVEICVACFTCHVISVRENHGTMHYEVSDSRTVEYRVVHTLPSSTATCS